MSEQTKRDLDQAIAAHIADENDGALLTGYVLQTRAKGFTDPDDDVKVRISRCTMEGQDFVTTAGLVLVLDADIRKSASEAD